MGKSPDMSGQWKKLPLMTSLSRGLAVTAFSTVWRKNSFAVRLTTRIDTRWAYMRAHWSGPSWKWKKPLPATMLLSSRDEIHPRLTSRFGAAIGVLLGLSLPGRWPPGRRCPAPRGLARNSSDASHDLGSDEPYRQRLASSRIRVSPSTSQPGHPARQAARLFEPRRGEPPTPGRRGVRGDPADGGPHPAAVHLVHLDRVAHAAQHRQRQPAAQVLAELLQPGEQVPRVPQDRVAQGQAQFAQAAEHAGHVALREAERQRRVRGVDRQAQGDRLAVAQGVTGERLHLVGRPVAEV